VAKRVLLTSFSTWKAHQSHNSSDQLLREIAQIPQLAESLHFLRQLPVNLPVARDIAIIKIQQIQPDIILCCGMAESRRQLNLEAQASIGEVVLKPNLDVEKLATGLGNTTVSYDAGRFVCNSLYHAVLNYLKCCAPDRDSLFVHVPLLTLMNREQIVADFRQLIERLLSDF
jgi:pyroglutamyl-peptidase